MTDTTLHTRLRDAILSLELAPGQPLSERGLEPAFGGSRTPIRAALMRLESEGLVRRDKRGWSVAPIDLDELAALGEYREILETAIVRLAVERATDADLMALAELVSAPDTTASPDDSLGTGTSFHGELAVLSANEFLVTALQGTLTRLYRTRWLEVRSPASRDRARTEHQNIVGALRARDSIGAELAILAHLRGTRERLAQSLAANRQQLRARGINLEGDSR
jgi:DNA-binding GntR family transcriptional regulator